MDLETPSASVCIGFRDWTGARTVAAVGTNAGSVALPFQKWRHFKEAFAPELIEQAVSETPGKVSRIVDPFGGSGTTALAAQFLGIEPATIEVNPFLADLIEAKLAGVDFNRAALALSRVVERAMWYGGDSHSAFPGAPRTLVEPGVEGRFILYRDIADRIVAYREAIATVTDSAIRRLFRVILASVSVRASNVVVSGKGRRYRRNWQLRRAPADAIDNSFRDGVAEALSDLRRFADRKCRNYTILRGDARRLVSSLPPHDLAVFSPPYPNSLDYTDVYNLELWLMGYLSSREQNTALRQKTLRSHVQIQRDMSARGVESPLLTDTVRRLEHASSRLWNQRIPQMIAAYTADLAIVLRGIAAHMRSGGRAYIVLGDSRYAGVNVPVAAILADLSPALGFEALRTEPCRSMRASPQQGGNRELAESLLVLERR